MTTINPPLLRLDGVSKRYGPTQALDGVDLELQAGEVLALMGENGAGKSTLMKILAGTEQRDSGRLRLDGQEIEIRSPNEARSHGIAIIHQELNTVPTMSVAENLALGNEPRTRVGSLDRAAMYDAARKKLARVGANIDPRRPLGDLSVGMQQLIEIARAVSENARVLVLDEPTAALSRSESEHLYRIINEMRTEGVGLIYISHRMEEVWELADSVTVFRDGRRVGSRTRAELDPAEIVRMMVGRPVDDLYQHDVREPGAVILKVSGLTAGTVGPIDLEVRAGEVVCLSGLVGSGRTEFARMVFGADRSSAGTISINGKQVSIASPTSAIRADIGMVPESRKDQALFLEHSVEDNISLSSLKRYTQAKVLQRRTIRSVVLKQMGRLRLRSNAVRLPVRALSGGNQQKAVLARWLMRGSQVLILDEPTRGVDIGAKREIYEIINVLAKQGKAILVISSDLPEAIGISDRILVMRSGRVVSEMASHETTEEQVMLYATGAADQRLGDK